MSNLEFVLSLRPKQVFKFIEFNWKKDLLVGIVKQKAGYYSLFIYDNENNKNYRMNYKWVNNKWKEDNE